MGCRRSCGVMALVVLPWASATLVVAIATPAIAAAFKYPDFESQWRNPAAGRGGDPWDITKPMGLAQQAPLTPEYQAIFEASVKDQAKGGQGNNYQSDCVLSGMPRIMSLVAPMEILIQPTTTYIIFQNNFARHIFTDGRAWPADEPPAFQGYSIGQWIDEDQDGRYDVLEVETRNFKGPRALESTGLPLHNDNQTVVQERLYLDKNDNNVLHGRITTIDHAFTRPWTVEKAYVRERNPRWGEYNCQKARDHVLVGKDHYLLSADGKLMPFYRDQPPPDLRYFKPPQRVR